MSAPDERVCLIDASLYVFRAWHSLPPDWRDAEGWPTHAVQGFANFLLQVLERIRPASAAVCFDESLGQGFRGEIYPAYKANRERPDEALLRQFGRCRELAAALGLAVLAHPRYEADDLIGSVAAQVHEQEENVLVLSADKDLTQLLREGDQQWDYPRERRYDPASVRARFGVAPTQMADLLALAGDPIDNIPGVHGIGQITAARLLRHFGSLDALLERVREVGHLRIRGAQALQRRLIEQGERALLSRRLTTIARDAPVPPLAQLGVRAPDLDTLDVLFDACGFGPFRRRRAAALAGGMG